MQSGKNYSFEIGCINFTNNFLDNVIISLDFYHEKGIKILLFRTNFTNNNVTLNQEKGSIICNVKNLPLANSLYQLSIYTSQGNHQILDFIENAAVISIEGSDFFDRGNP